VYYPTPIRARGRIISRAITTVKDGLYLEQCVKVLTKP
jgi:hypothetical protein